MTKIPKDKRDKLWAEIELSIQKRSLKKDPSFLLKGKWKKFVRNQNGYKVFAVDGKWIRNNICCYFGHGGHGRVHEFIPMGEIWIATHHYADGNLGVETCSCKVRMKHQKVSKNYFDSTTIHEIEECEQMEKGKHYWEAHNIALEKERQVGLLNDPFEDL